MTAFVLSHGVKDTCIGDMAMGSSLWDANVSFLTMLIHAALKSVENITEVALCNLV